MTPADRAEIMTMIREALKAERPVIASTLVQPVQDQVDFLKQTDRKHSGMHREILAGVEDVRRTGEHAKLETTEYIARTLDDFRKEMREAAQNAPAQVQATKVAAEQVQEATVAVQAAAATIDDKADKKDITKSRNEGRIRTFVMVVLMVVTWVYDHYDQRRRSDQHEQQTKEGGR